MFRTWLHTVLAVALILATTALPHALSGQAINTLPRGFSASGALAVGRPVFSERTEQTLIGVGSGGVSTQAVVGLGFHAGTIGAELEVTAGSMTLNGSRAGTLAVAALMHVNLRGRFGGLRPQATVGYVRHGVNDVTVLVAQLPPDLQSFFPNATTIEGLGIIGNGTRVGLALHRPLTQRVSLAVNGSLDAIRYGSVTSDGSEVAFRDAGWSYLPRVTVGARFSLSR